MDELERLRFPIGRFDASHVSGDEREGNIREIEAAPRYLRAAVHGLSADMLETPYREGGWTVRQVVHHLPDSHMNSYVRFRLALTEKLPTIRTYDEAAWAALPDAKSAGIAASLDLLDALHARWVFLLRALNDDDWERELLHPELGRLTLDSMLAHYAWHGRHHVAHIAALRDRSGW